MWFWLLVIIAILWVAYAIVNRIRPAWWTTGGGRSWRNIYLYAAIPASIILAILAARDGYQTVRAASAEAAAATLGKEKAVLEEQQKQTKKELTETKERAEALHREVETHKKQEAEKAAVEAEATRQRGDAINLEGVPLQPWDTCRFASALYPGFDLVVQEYSGGMGKEADSLQTLLSHTIGGVTVHAYLIEGNFRRIREKAPKVWRALKDRIIKKINGRSFLEFTLRVGVKDQVEVTADVTSVPEEELYSWYESALRYRTFRYTPPDVGSYFDRRTGGWSQPIRLYKKPVAIGGAVETRWFLDIRSGINPLDVFSVLVSGVNIDVTTSVPTLTLITTDPALFGRDIQFSTMDEGFGAKVAPEAARKADLKELERLEKALGIKPHCGATVEERLDVIREARSRSRR